MLRPVDTRFVENTAIVGPRVRCSKTGHHRHPRSVSGGFLAFGRERRVSEKPRKYATNTTMCRVSKIARSVIIDKLG